MYAVTQAGSAAERLAIGANRRGRRGSAGTALRTGTDCLVG